MSAPVRLVAFAALLAVVFGGAALAGSLLEPTAASSAGGSAGRASGHMAAMEDARGGRGAMAASGLAVSSAGLTVEVDRTAFGRDRRQRLSFRIVDAHGRVLRDQFQYESARKMHLIVVRRDTSAYQHLHPQQGRDGTWSVDVALPEAGVYRAFADFQIAGAKHVLAVDLFVPGQFTPHAFPAPRATARTGDLAVDLATPGLSAGRATTLTFVVTRNGRPVSDLEPYLGAKGHLVALREGDLAYLHVHPDEARLPRNQIQFMSTFPTPGTYRLFLQFRRDGAVRTAAYTLEVPR